MSIPKSESWGLGPAKVVGRATRALTEVNVIVSDIHYPHHDADALDSALNLITALEPHRVGINGDTGDYFQISTHNRQGRGKETLQKEINGTNSIRSKVRQSAPNALIDENWGNHEERITEFIRKDSNPFAYLDAVQPEKLFHWEENEITPHGTNGYRLRPGFLVKHGTLIRGEGGITAKAERMAAGINGVSGHTHRLAKYRKDGYTPQEWHEGGCLCRLDPDYVEVPNWQHGLLIIFLSTKTDAFKVEMVSTLGGRFTYGGKVY